MKEEITQNTDDPVIMENVEVDKEEAVASPSYIEKSTMPVTRNYMVMKAFKGMNMRKFNSPHNRQNSNKQSAIKKRQRKLRKIGWNLMYFPS